MYYRSLLFFFLRSGFRLWSSLHSCCQSTVTQKKSNSADYSKSRGKTIDKQRLFLIITIDMLSFRALLSFLSHYCACHIQAMQLRLVNSSTRCKGVISDLDCNFKILQLSVLGGNERRPPEERRITERGKNCPFFFYCKPILASSAL